MIEYFSLDEGKALIARITPSETYRILNSSGEWLDGAGTCEGYIFNGEPGAEPITDAEARDLAEGFGETLVPIEKIEKEFSTNA